MENNQAIKGHTEPENHPENSAANPTTAHSEIPLAVYRFIQNRQTYFGPGARRKIGEIIGRQPFGKALVVTDPNLVTLGITDLITLELAQLQIPYVLYDQVQANPTIENVQRGVDCFRQAGADFIVAIGGGSALDTAKGIGIIVTNPDFYDVISLEGADKSSHPSIPVIAIPTTAGTGSETTMDYVITHTQEKRKMACMDIHAMPLAAILDLEIMAAMPAGLTAATAMDALTHAIESYTAKGSWILSEAYALQAVGLITKSLLSAWDHPQDMRARQDLAVAQYLAGASFTNVGLGLVHAMAHPLSAHFDLHHGVANALVLPYVIAYNVDCVAAKYARVSEAMGNSFPQGTDDMTKARLAIDQIRDLLQRTGLPDSLAQVGVDSQDLPLLAESAARDISAADNPKEASVVQILSIYEKIQPLGLCSKHNTLCAGRHMKQTGDIIK